MHVDGLRMSTYATPRLSRPLRGHETLVTSLMTEPAMAYGGSRRQAPPSSVAPRLYQYFIGALVLQASTTPTQMGTPLPPSTTHYCRG